MSVLYSTVFLIVSYQGFLQALGFGKDVLKYYAGGGGGGGMRNLMCAFFLGEVTKFWGGGSAAVARLARQKSLFMLFRDIVTAPNSI